MSFEREERYIVVKIKDLSASQAVALCRILTHNHIHTRECVVVEPDWPIYEQTWDAVRRLSQGMEQEADALRSRLQEIEAERDALAECLEAAQRIADADRVDHPVHTMSDGEPVEFVSPGWRTKMGRDLHVALKGGSIATGLARRDARMKAEALHEAEHELGKYYSPCCRDAMKQMARMYRQQAEGGGDE
ncbi:hypothetical protein KUW00_18210 [Halomonas sp. DP5N14-9]|uniref:hypothetical protein n=1 Tax=Halomonas sp. DP5N14-9 TaxID=2859075 RepID=UPI001C9932A2|nr:hypothetical protein [Halomonas sp. DP5N14-9]MBY5942814.1 hypothetical protein [Halomonas sp. DP5N14-9]